jgi:sortase B
VAYYQRHPIVHFNTLYERHNWKIFAVVLFNTEPDHGEVFNYHTVHEFKDADHFNEYILNIMDRSVLFTDVDLEYGDKILTLSTCYYYPLGEKVDSRCVVFARKVREGEKSTVNTEAAFYNNKELRFTEQERRLGSNWTGRVWDTSKLKSYNGE